MYSVVVDAESGDTLESRSLTSEAGLAALLSPTTRTRPRWSRSRCRPPGMTSTTAARASGASTRAPTRTPTTRIRLQARRQAERACRSPRAAAPWTTPTGSTPARRTSQAQTPLPGQRLLVELRQPRDQGDQPVPGRDHRPRAHEPLPRISRHSRRSASTRPPATSSVSIRAAARQGQRLRQGRDQRRRGSRQRELRHAGRWQRAAHADVPVRQNRRRQRQRHRLRRLPRDHARSGLPPDHKRQRQLRAGPDPVGHDGRGVGGLLLDRPAGVRRRPGRHRGARRAQAGQPRRARRRPREADGLPGQPRRRRRLQRRFRDPGARRLHLRRPRGHRQHEPRTTAARCGPRRCGTCAPPSAVPRR